MADWSQTLSTLIPIPKNIIIDWKIKNMGKTTIIFIYMYKTSIRYIIYKLSYVNNATDFFCLLSIIFL